MEPEGDRGAVRADASIDVIVKGLGRPLRMNVGRRTLA